METVKDGKQSVVILPEAFSKISIQRKKQHQILTIFFLYMPSISVKFQNFDHL
jgi:hypothetical protein